MKIWKIVKSDLFYLKIQPDRDSELASPSDKQTNRQEEKVGGKQIAKQIGGQERSISP